ncbi:MAG: imidazole glycerol phosphate synthase subunit HisH [Anaerolineae bacterium]|nr:imidazole glycerol phosphate synthase subunit HisH [Anaerolineae bacterium]
MSQLVIVDYGVGNFRNVQKGFEAVGVAAEITASVQALTEAHAVVLPGVGAFGDAMSNLRARDQVQPVLDAAAAGKPIFGICVGLQLLFDESDEMGHHQGLGLIPGKVIRFSHELTVPHMGWNQIEPAGDHPLLKNVAWGDYAYFAHSYHAQPSDQADVVACTDYGTRFPSIVSRDNVCAIQFHPEKSQRVGLQILKNFAEWAGVA